MWRCKYKCILLQPDYCVLLLHELHYSGINTERRLHFNQIFVQRWESKVEHIFFDFGSDSGKILFWLRLWLRLCNTTTFYSRRVSFAEPKVYNSRSQSKNLESKDAKYFWHCMTQFIFAGGHTVVRFLAAAQSARVVDISRLLAQSCRYTDEYEPEPGPKPKTCDQTQTVIWSQNQAQKSLKIWSDLKMRAVIARNKTTHCWLIVKQ